MQPAIESRLSRGADDRLETARVALSAAGESIVKACSVSTITASKAKGHASRCVQEAEEAVQLLEQATGRGGGVASSKAESPEGKSSQGVEYQTNSNGGSPASLTDHVTKINPSGKSDTNGRTQMTRHLPSTPEANSPSGGVQVCMKNDNETDGPDRLFLEAEASLSLADSDVSAPTNYKKARTLFEAAARGGHARGMLRYGQCLSQGLGGPKDEAEGRMWVTRSAVEGVEEAECEVALLKERRHGPGAAIPLLRSLVSKGNTGACVRLAELMLAGDCEGDEQTAESLLIKAGQAGDGWAWNRVGVLRTLRSPAPPPGEDSAVTAFQRGCELGCRDAMNNMGVLCEDSEPPDFAEACGWYAKAAALGHLDAVNNLGYALLVQGDARGAVAKFEEAVRRGWGGDARFNLASVLEHGSGCFKDVQRAKRLYLEAAEGGCGKSAYRAGCLLYEDGDSEGSVKYFKQSAASGNPRAMNALGVMMEGSQGGGEEWYREASERGCADAAFNMGLVCERDGRREAVEWYRKAHEMGHGGAMAEVLRLEMVFEGGQGGPRRESGWDKGNYRDRILYLGAGDEGGDGLARGLGGGDPYAKFYDEMLEGKIRLEDVVEAVEGGQGSVEGEDGFISKWRQQKQSPKMGADCDTLTPSRPQQEFEGRHRDGAGGVAVLPASRGSSSASTPKIGMKGLLGEARHLGDEEGKVVAEGGSQTATPGGRVISRAPDSEKDEAVLRLLGAL